MDGSVMGGIDSILAKQYWNTMVQNTSHYPKCTTYLVQYVYFDS